MPSLKAIRRRISSVKGTQKITRAMKMVAGARLARAQQRILALRPYAVRTAAMLADVTAALHGLAHDEDRRRDYLADAAAYADRFRLTLPQRAALLGLDTPALVAMGVHPLVAFLANMQVERQRKA